MTPTHFIIHTIQIKPGSLDAAKALFEEKVPALAGRYQAWCGARFTACRKENQIVTIGAWADPDQLRAFTEDPAFNEAMAGFAEYFAAPPQTTITRVLAEVGPEA